MKDKICGVIQNLISLLISWVITTQQLKKWDLHTFSTIWVTKDKICGFIQNLISLLILWVITTKELKKWDLHMFSTICGDSMPTI